MIAYEYFGMDSRIPRLFHLLNQNPNHSRIKINHLVNLLNIAGETSIGEKLMEEMSDYQWVLVPNFTNGNRKMIENGVCFDSSESDHHNLEICHHEVFLAEKGVGRCANNHHDKPKKAHA